MYYIDCMIRMNLHIKVNGFIGTADTLEHIPVVGCM